MKIDNKIRQFRKERKWSQVALAEKIGVSRQTIISLESGKYIASLPVAYQLATLFNVPIEELFIFNKEQ